MVAAGDFRIGMTFEEEGNIFQVVEAQYIKPGKRAPFIRTTLKNVRTGSILEKDYYPTAKFNEVTVEGVSTKTSTYEPMPSYYMDPNTQKKTLLNPGKFFSDLK